MTWTQQVQGPVFRPGDSEFDEETSGFQTAYKHRPAYAVAATGADDVRAALAGAGGLPVAVQATGHGRTVPLDGGVLISTRRMTGLRVDPGRRSAWIEAGVRWQQVITAAAEHGLAPLSGSSPEVGAVGYILGGGLGVLARRYGYAADHVSSIDLAAADGSLRHVTADDDPDLFRELRGAGHGLGVVTAMEIGLVPVTRLYGGGPSPSCGTPSVSSRTRSRPRSTTTRPGRIPTAAQMRCSASSIPRRCATSSSSPGQARRCPASCS